MNTLRLQISLDMGAPILGVSRRRDADRPRGQRPATGCDSWRCTMRKTTPACQRVSPRADGDVRPLFAARLDDDSRSYSRDALSAGLGVLGAWRNGDERERQSVGMQPLADAVRRRRRTTGNRCHDSRREPSARGLFLRQPARSDPRTRSTKSVLCMPIIRATPTGISTMELHPLRFRCWRTTGICS